MARSQPTTLLVGAIISTALLGALPVSTVQADDDHDDGRSKRNFRVGLSPYQEVPAISSVAKGEFRLRISRDGQSMGYELSYSGLEGTVTQAHIHFGQKHVNGGISVFLCGTGTGGTAGPAGTPVCPQSGSVERTVTAADVIGPAGQGIEAQALAELVAAIRAGKAYANVHSTKWPGGEIRGQIK